MADDYTELLVSIGRIEEGIRHLREDVSALRTDLQGQKLEVDEVKRDIHSIELDIKELKTQRNSNKSTVAILISIGAIATSIALKMFP